MNNVAKTAGMKFTQGSTTWTSLQFAERAQAPSQMDRGVSNYYSLESTQ